MKRILKTLIYGIITVTLSACGSGGQSSSVSQAAQTTASSQAENSTQQTETTSTEAASESASEESTQEETAQSETTTTTEESSPQPEDTQRRISVQFGENQVIYQLNDSPAADSLYEQLPLTAEVSDFSDNEKIFYPPSQLDTADSPLAQSGAGTLAYYAPWGDVVMFYGDYSENPSLYELGQVVSGEELVSSMSGTVTITAID